MQVPTTQRKYYDTTKKVSPLGEYAGAVKQGAEAWGSVIDQQQRVKIESQLETANTNIKNEFKRKSLEYDNNPDNPEFKQYMDEYRKSEYEKARQDVMPMYRGMFDSATRESDKQYNTAFDSWKTVQRQQNASNDVKKLSQSMIDNAYLAGQSGDISMAQAQFNKVVPLIRGISTTTLGARATEQGIEDLEKQYLLSFASGQIEKSPSEADVLIKSKEFIKKVGAENAKKLQNYSDAQKSRIQKEEIHGLIENFNKKPTKEALEAIKNQDIVKLSDKKISELESMYNESPNYICETNGEAVEQISKRLAEFAKNDYVIKNGEKKGSVDIQSQFDDAVDLSKFIMAQNSENGTLSDADRMKYMSSVAKIMRDGMVRRAFINTQGAMGEFFDTVGKYNPLVSVQIANQFAKKRQYVSSSERAAINGVVLATMKGAFESLERGDEKAAYEYFRTGSREIIDIRNPEVRGKNKDDYFSKDGQTYQITGFDNNDVNVRIIYK